MIDRVCFSCVRGFLPIDQSFPSASASHDLMFRPNEIAGQKMLDWLGRRTQARRHLVTQTGRWLVLGPCQAKCLSMLSTTSCHTDRKVTCAWPLPSKMPFHAFRNILSHRQESDLCLAPAKQNALPCFSQHFVTQTGK